MLPKPDLPLESVHSLSPFLIEELKDSGAASVASTFFKVVRKNLKSERGEDNLASCEDCLLYPLSHIIGERFSLCTEVTACREFNRADKTEVKLLSCTQSGEPI